MLVSLASVALFMASIFVEKAGRKLLGLPPTAKPVTRTLCAALAVLLAVCLSYAKAPA
jgi:hypothetical protein